LHGDAVRFPGLGLGPYAMRAVRGGACAAPVVIGGGLIGIEVVETLIAAGRRPVFLLRDDAFWPIALDAVESAWVVGRLRAHGVDVRTGVRATGVRADARGVCAVLTDAGEIAADLCVVAIGVRPNTDWLEGLVDLHPASRGVLVDSGLRTSVPDIWAAGDCAAVPWADGTVRPELLWYTSRDQGRVAGRALTGDRQARYQRGVATNAAKLLDTEYLTAGRCEGAPAARMEERGPVRSLLRIHADEGVVVGFSSLGSRWHVATWVRWIEERRSVDWVRRNLTDASFDTEFVPAWGA
jgi:phenylglyoxylate dehydrogenase epsilon subunit